MASYSESRRRGFFIADREQRTVAALYIGVSMIIALCVSDLGVILGLVGASTGMVISFITPAACYVMLTRGRGALRAAALATLVLSLVLLPLCVAMQFVA